MQQEMIEKLGDTVYRLHGTSQLGNARGRYQEDQDEVKE